MKSQTVIHRIITFAPEERVLASIVVLKMVRDGWDFTSGWLDENEKVFGIEVESPHVSFSGKAETVDLHKIR